MTPSGIEPATFRVRGLGVFKLWCREPDAHPNGGGWLLPACSPTPNRNLKENTGFVDVMVSVVMCDLPCDGMSRCDRLMTSAVEFWKIKTWVRLRWTQKKKKKEEEEEGEPRRLDVVIKIDWLIDWLSQWVSYGTCSDIYMYISAVTNSAVFTLWHNFVTYS